MATNYTRVNERLAIVELRMDAMEKALGVTAGKVDDMHELLMQAKGARWIVLGAIALVGVPTIYNSLMSNWK